MVTRVKGFWEDFCSGKPVDRRGRIFFTGKMGFNWDGNIT